ncbi:hypothetical protein SARC_12728 [Sphaeroforma arctica JP610]|uniref:Uncharacterized protein n=1 Tax=Sphaeroforma arctica JP610 TaxID=667725 RepID=A0A0L0FDA4_9EUKA|nr:hypothetical protein SARC_12728 [Sphaeroforma arctica JP610]KNC74732.1 hypothetical protein SARC_12728 [Sphaeroforma arctica JP610]|eukprot:XP_014148634.1 hypothetical protein SARC_12728 [Sphaeroforma arctica JP610]
MDRSDALNTVKYSRARFSESRLEAAIQFILSEENVCLISWGTKSLRIGRNEIVTLPTLTRRKPAQVLYKDYLVSADEDEQIGKTSFMKVVLSITNNDEKLITAVDYVTGCLVTDVVDTMQTILEDLSEDQAERTRLSTLVNLGKTFIKQQLDHKVVLEDSINTHGCKIRSNKGDTNALE